MSTLRPFEASLAPRTSPIPLEGSEGRFKSWSFIFATSVFTKKIKKGNSRAHRRFNFRLRLVQMIVHNVPYVQ